ncbi:RNA polymerase II-associated protein 3-like protein [Aphelenchoides avenae]|nr:RNA polymerase II-associated protein 3-like protein [Aphelenchus avenae]
MPSAYWTVELQIGSQPLQLVLDTNVASTILLDGGNSNYDPKLSSFYRETERSTCGWKMPSLPYIDSSDYWLNGGHAAVDVKGEWATDQLIIAGENSENEPVVGLIAPFIRTQLGQHELNEKLAAGGALGLGAEVEGSASTIQRVLRGFSKKEITLWLGAINVGPTPLASTTDDEVVVGAKISVSTPFLEAPVDKYHEIVETLRYFANVSDSDMPGIVFVDCAEVSALPAINISMGLDYTVRPEDYTIEVNAVDAYTVALSFRFDDAHKFLARRAEAYLKLNKFREAYIDANEAIKFRNNRREPNSSDEDWLQRVFFSKAIALRHLGFVKEASLNWEVGLRRGTGNADLEAEFRAAKLEPTAKLHAKVSAPTVEADFLTNYDPLESDSPEFGREQLLGDINRFIINEWRRPPADQDLSKFDFSTWRSVCSLLSFLNSEYMKPREGGPIPWTRVLWQICTLRLCFADNDWRNRSIHMQLLFNHEAAYLNAKKEYDVCLEHGNLGQMANVAATVAEELKEMGLFHEAKRALEPALRFLRLSNLENHAAIELYANLKLKKDEPKIAFKDLLKMDVMDSFEGDYSAEILRKVRPAYINAMGMIYRKQHANDAQKPFSDVREGAPPEKILEVDGDEACRLYSIAYHASGRCAAYTKSGHVIRPDDYVHYRGWCHLLNDNRYLEAYIDACETNRLRPDTAQAYELKALALRKMGFEITIAHPASAKPDTTFGQSISPPPIGYYDKEMLTGDYDPTLSDYYGDGLRLTASERKVLKEARDVEKARKCIEDGHYEEAIDLLNGPIESFPQPDVLTLRAKAYLGIDEFSKALEDAEAALRLDRIFYEATIVCAKAHSALWNYGEARQALEEYLELGPDNDDADQLRKSLADKKCEPTAEEIQDLQGIELPHYGPATLETAIQLLRVRFLQSVDAIRTRLRVVENGLEQKEAALTAAESKNTPLAEENSQLKADLKAATKAKNQLEEMKKKLREAENAPMTEKEKNLDGLLSQKEQALRHAVRANETLQQQCHALKDEAERVKEERKSWKSQVKSTEELQRRLEKARQETAKAEATVKEQREAMDHMLATEEESKRKDMENRGIAEYVVHINSLPFLDIIRLLQRNNMESDAKLRKLEQRNESLEKQLTDKRVENSGLLSQLLNAVEALKTEQELHRDAAQSGSETTNQAIEATQSVAVSPPAAASEQLEAFKNGVYATLTGNVDGYSDMRTLVEHLREDIGADGESKAREFGFESLEAFLRSTAMKDQVFVQDGEDGSVYKARPNATNRHQHEARVISAEGAARRRDRRAFFEARDRMQSAVDDERNRANALAEELQDVREELRRQRDETAELETEARCQICMDGRPNQTTFVVRNDDGGEVTCGHVSCDDCAQTLTTCPRCSRRIVSRIRFYL